MEPTTVSLPAPAVAFAKGARRPVTATAVHLPALALGALAGALAVGGITASYEHVGVVLAVQAIAVAVMLKGRGWAVVAGAGACAAAGLGWPSGLPVAAGLTGFAAAALAILLRIDDGRRAAALLSLPLAVLALQTAGTDLFVYTVPILLVGAALLVALLRAPDAAWRGLYAVAGALAVFFVFA